MHPILGTRTTTAVASREHRLPEEWISIIVAKLYSLAERSLYSKSSRSSQEVCIHSYHFLCILNNNFDEKLFRPPTVLETFVLFCLDISFLI